MLTSARERLEVLKLRRAGKIHQEQRKAGASPRSIQREIVPHTQILMPIGEKQVDYWKDITVKKDQELAEREKREKEANRKFREEQKRLLDEHVAIASARAVNKPEEDRKDRDVVDKVYEDYINEKKQKKQKDRELEHKIGIMRAEQVALKKKRLEADVEEKREFERRAVERAKEALRQEKQLMQMQKVEAHALRQEVAKENARLKELKQERKAAIDAEDAQALSRFTAVLEHQAAVSKAEFEHMKDKMKMRETIAFDIHKTWKDKLKEDEERAAKLTREREAAAARREEEAAKLAKQKTIAIKREVRKQADERKKLEARIALEKEQEKLAAKQESESIRREREAERAAKLAKQKAVEDELNAQIREQKSRQTIIMSEVERKMNSHSLPKGFVAPDARLDVQLIR